ncbi:hypothetical protein EV567_2341 [Streptomyces sp. BK239]|nr:hypothetical protein EV567_2341 [Streptomyces sp. BK239]
MYRRFSGAGPRPAVSLATTAVRAAPGRDPAHVTDVYHAVRVTTTVREYTSHHEHRRQG